MTPRPYHFENGSLVVLVGAPACGKTYFTSHYPSSWRVSLDAFRCQITDTEADEGATPAAMQLQTIVLNERLCRARTTLVDSTNVHQHRRTALRALARYWERPLTAVLFNPPLETLRKQNAARERQVPDHILVDFHRLVPTAEQLSDEGFHHVLRALAPTREDGPR
jgi:predicted kinase